MNVLKLLECFIVNAAGRQSVLQPGIGQKDGEANGC